MGTISAQSGSKTLQVQQIGNCELPGGAAGAGIAMTFLHYPPLSGPTHGSAKPILQSRARGLNAEKEREPVQCSYTHRIRDSKSRKRKGLVLERHLRVIMSMSAATILADLPRRACTEIKNHGNELLPQPQVGLEINCTGCMWSGGTQKVRLSIHFKNRGRL